jgi:hypothetical protein
MIGAVPVHWPISSRVLILIWPSPVMGPAEESPRHCTERREHELYYCYSESTAEHSYCNKC